ncbi:MAG: nucleotidyltransferase substrate binding protein [Planctomycetes bacterium]|nr:nucleotidyltransferase substrate binding protein [Planctomycetota bacterium]
MNRDVRWKQRFQNLDRAVKLLKEPIARGIETLSQLEKEGTVQRFEFALELAWKTMKDFLEHQGTVIAAPITPRGVIKAAFGAKLIADGQVWIDMIDQRNLLSHTYDSKILDDAAKAMRDRYLPAITELHAWFAARRNDP